MLLVTDLLFQSTTVKVTIAATATLYTALWFGIALVRRMLGESSHDG